MQCTALASLAPNNRVLRAMQREKASVKRAGRSKERTR